MEKEKEKEVKPLKQKRLPPADFKVINFTLIWNTSSFISFDTFKFALLIKLWLYFAKKICGLENISRVLVHKVNSTVQVRIKVPINPKLLFCLNKYMYNSEQNGAKIFDLGQNRNFL